MRQTAVDLEVEEISDFTSDPVELDSDNDDDIVPSLINALDSEEVFLPIDEGDTPMVDDNMVSPPNWRVQIWNLKCRPT